ncbi:MAG: Rrf2 family transcriptional regulator [Clostridiales bacterium]|nr:Rrf2 family transcriptional regulator [Clostridiales bacterium]
MRASKRFPLAVHSLLFVAVLSPKKRVTSTLVAESTDSNPVTVRNIFLNLSESGLLIAAAGKNGGVHLAKDPKDITLWDIYQAVETNDVEKIFKLHETDSDCPVGKNFYQILLPHMVTAVNAMKANMEQVTLETLMNELKQLLKNSPEDLRAQKKQELSIGPDGWEVKEH